MLFYREGEKNMYRRTLLSVIFCLMILSISAQTTSAQTPGQKGKKATQDSLKSASSDTTKLPKQRKWIKGVLEREEQERAIDSVRATYKDTTTSPYELMKAQKKGIIPLLIIRPVSGFGVSTLKNKWLLLLCEAYIHFRLGAIPALSIVSPDKLSDVLPYYNEYKRAIPTGRYKKAAKELSVPYLLYLQCGYTKVSREVNFLGDVSSVDNGRPIATASKSFPLREFGAVLDQFAIQIVEKMGIEPAEQTRFFLNTPLMSGKAKILKAVGENLSTVNEVKDKWWSEFLNRYNELLREDPQMLVGYYAAAKFCGAAEKYKEAAEFSYALVHKLGHKYPPAYLMTARYYRLSGNYAEALRVVDRAEIIVEIQKPLKEEKARITEGARKAEKVRKSKK